MQGATWRSTARGEGRVGEDQVKGSGENKSRFGPRDLKRSGGVAGGLHGARIDKEA